MLGFPGGSEGKAPACNAGDLGSIPGLGRSPGEGNGNPLEQHIYCVTPFWPAKSLLKGQQLALWEFSCKLLVGFPLSLLIKHKYLKLNHFAVHLKLTQPSLTNYAPI